MIENVQRNSDMLIIVSWCVVFELQKKKQQILTFKKLEPGCLTAVQEEKSLDFFPSNKFWSKKQKSENCEKNNQNNVC